MTGTDLTRGGTRTRASGVVKSENGKKAISEMIDSSAKLLKGGVAKSATEKEKDPKNPPRPKKEKTAEEEAKAKEKKDLQKDIRMFLCLKHWKVHPTYQNHIDGQG